MHGLIGLFAGFGLLIALHQLMGDAFATKWFWKPVGYVTFWLLIAMGVLGLKQIADGKLGFGPGGGYSGYGAQYDR